MQSAASDDVGQDSIAGGIAGDILKEDGRGTRGVLQEGGGKTDVPLPSGAGHSLKLAQLVYGANLLSQVVVDYLAVLEHTASPSFAKEGVLELVPIIAYQRAGERGVPRIRSDLHRTVSGLADAALPRMTSFRCQIEQAIRLSPLLKDGGDRGQRISCATSSVSLTASGRGCSAAGEAGVPASWPDAAHAQGRVSLGGDPEPALPDVLASQESHSQG